MSNYANFTRMYNLEDIPERTGKIKKVHIKDKLKEIGVEIEDLQLGTFDQIGEFTAKKARSADSKEYKTAGCFFRPNYERGILIYSLIKKYNIKSFLEIGFGRGYATLCAAMAMHEAFGPGEGRIVTIDPGLDEKFINFLSEKYPAEWFKMIEFKKGFSNAVVPSLDEKFDFIYIDGDHTYNAVKEDWENTKEKFNKFLMFDDYHLPTKTQSEIQCANLIDSIDDDTKELIIMDRRIFFDDRRIPDEEIDYGQVLLTNSE
jgi:predicted O-methyltransferase YrrM